MTQARIAFLGTGNMGGALIAGALKAKIASKSSISAYDAEPGILAKTRKKTGIKAAGSNAQAVKGAHFIFLCVKPQQMGSLLEEIGPHVTSKQCLVSIAAGIPLSRIESAFSDAVPVIRVMPNTPALIGFGAAAIAGGSRAKKPHLEFVLRFFQAVGKAVVLPENLLDAVTAISGSGPAYVFYLAEGLAAACEKLGLPEEAARTLWKQTILGAALMLDRTTDPASELRRKVTSPGGTTEAAIRYLENQKWLDMFVEAVQKAKERSRELSQA